MEFMDSVRKQFLYYRQLGEKTIEQVDEEGLFWQYNPESNSIATIVKHLWGNMLSRWTDFLNSDGEKEWRQRDAEFENDLETRNQVTEKWNEGWDCLEQALSGISDKDLDRTVYIRNQGHTVAEALSRQLAHYASHVGQIIYIGKMIKGGEWKTLSIPKGGSKAFNDTKFAAEKGKAHYTDEFLKKD